MKKSWIKSLLVLVMALLLVFALVACNPNEGDDGNGPENGGNDTDTTDFTTGEYFNKLWDLTSDLGSNPVGATDDIAIHMGVVLSLNTRNNRGTKAIVQQMDLGLDIQAVLGRTKGTSENTALKVKLYDPSDADHDEIVTIYLLANELDNIYLDFSGYNVSVPHNIATTVWNEVLEHATDNKLGANIATGLDWGFLGDDEKSINDILNDFLGDFGPEWTLNTLLNKVVKMLGLNLSELIDTYWDTISGFIKGLNKEDLIDANGNVNLDKILNISVIQKLFTATKSTTAGVTTYKAVIDSMLIGLLSGESFLPNAGLKDMFVNGKTTGEIALSFTEKNNAIDSFSLSAVLAGMQTSIGKLNANDKNDTVVVPEIVVSITDLSIAKADNTNKIAINTDDYKEDIAVEEKLTFGVHGVTIGTIEELGNEPITLDHDVQVTLVGKVDLVNVENNKTQLNLYVDLKSGEEAFERFATVSFADGKLAGALANAIEFQGDMVKGFVFDIGVNVAEMFHGFVESIARDIFNKPVEAVSSALDENGEEFLLEGAAFSGTNWVNAIKTLLPLLRTDNDFQLTLNNALTNIVDIVNNFGSKHVYEQKTDANGQPVVDKDNKPVKDWKDYNYFTWTRVGREKRIISILTNPPMSDMGLMDCVQFIMEKLMPSEKEPAPDEGQIAEGEEVKEPTIVDAALRILYICAQAVEIDGVEVPTDGDAYVENIKAVLASTIAVKGDLKDGVHASIEVKIADATLYINESLELVKIVEDGENATFEDVYAQFTAATEEEKAQWIDLAEIFA